MISQPSRPTRSRLVPTLLLLGATAVAAATLPRPAHAAPVREADLLELPCFATCGQYRWFLRHSVDVRENGQCCMPLIKQAKKLERKALRLYEQAATPGSENQSDLVRRANQLIGKRGRKIRQFIDCVNGVQQALNLQKRGFDATVDYAIACRVTPLCEGEL